MGCIACQGRASCSRWWLLSKGRKGGAGGALCRTRDPPACLPALPSCCCVLCVHASRLHACMQACMHAESQPRCVRHAAAGRQVPASPIPPSAPPTCRPPRCTRPMLVRPDIRVLPFLQDGGGRGTGMGRDGGGGGAKARWDAQDGRNTRQGALPLSGPAQRCRAWPQHQKSRSPISASDTRPPPPKRAARCRQAGVLAGRPRSSLEASGPVGPAAQEPRAAGGSGDDVLRHRASKAQREGGRRGPTAGLVEAPACCFLVQRQYVGARCSARSVARGTGLMHQVRGEQARGSCAAPSAQPGRPNRARPQAA